MIRVRRALSIGAMLALLGACAPAIPVAGSTLVATICEGGYRSSLAASLLAHDGISPLTNVSGGMTAYRALEKI